jgi:hypothetical protein
MKRINQAIGLVTMIMGIGVASAGPEVFLAVVGGNTLPTPVADDRTAMTVWAGIAFARAFGAALSLLGAILWAANRDAKRNLARSAVLFGVAAFATFVLCAQQIAIWSTSVGFIFVVLLALITISAGAGLIRSTRAHA